MVQYAVKANCVPTVVTYEKQELSSPVSVQAVRDVRCLLSEEQMLLLYYGAIEMGGEDVNKLMEDE